MLEDLMGKSNKMQEELAAKLSTIIVEEKVDGVTITANAAREITAIDISPSLLNHEGKEQLEDVLIIALNRIITTISQKEQEESAAIMKAMLPPGFDNLFG
jgi:nucleoid-associated protein EbfC